MAIFTFAFTKLRAPGNPGGVPLFGWILRRQLDWEI
jgi:hypothetical protein